MTRHITKDGCTDCIPLGLSGRQLEASDFQNLAGAIRHHVLPLMCCRPAGQHACQYSCAHCMQPFASMTCLATCEDDMPGNSCPSKCFNVHAMMHLLQEQYYGVTCSTHHFQHILVARKVGSRPWAVEAWLASTAGQRCLTAHRSSGTHRCLAH